MYGGERGSWKHRSGKSFEAEWRRRQRLRRRRLTPRGRAVLSILCVTLGAALGVAVKRLGVSRASAGPMLAAPSPVSAASAAAPRPLSDLLARLPAGRDALELSRSSFEPEAGGDVDDPAAPSRLVEWLPAPAGRPDIAGPLRVEYSLDAELTRRVFAELRRARTKRGHVIVLDARSGRVLVYASTDPERFPATRAYPAASLVKVITAAAALQHAPEQARKPCRYRGSPYRLTRSRLRPPARGNEMSLERSLATSNNQCFAQLAVNVVGRDALMAAIARFGWLEQPAPGHAAGVVTASDDDYELGRLGSGLGGGRITPLHAAQLAASLAQGELVAPWWIDRVLDAEGREVALPQRRPGRRVMAPELAQELRSMLVRTTASGTARSAFRNRRGRAKLGEIRVAGKTGNITGSDPRGRYEWFIGVAPAEDPTIAIAVLQLHGHLWWMKSSEIAAEVLVDVFCERGGCRPQLASRYTGSLGSAVAPIFLSESGR